jgi:hypothetical protein
MELNPAGDLTGDHITDFTLSKPFLRDRNAPAQRVVLVNGKTGAALLNSDADTARPLGDIDGDGAAEVLLSSAFNSNTVAEVDHQAVDAAGGVIWDQSFSVTGVADAASMLLSSPGDVDGDGVDEIAHQLTVRKDTSSTDVIEDLRIISGRTGQSIRATGPVGSALGGSLDGNGDDLAAVSSFGASAVDVSAVNGRTGATMFTKRLRPRGDVTRISRVDGADVTGDGILDLIVNTEALVEEGPEIPGVSSPEPAFVWDGFVVNGRTGALVWSTDAPGQPVEPDLKGTVSAAAPYSWNGPNATGVNVQVTGEAECRTEPTALCQDILVEISNPPAEGDASATRAASVVLDQFGPVVEPATDFDLYVHESDQLGTIGPLVDQSFSAGGNPVDGPEGERVTLQVTTTKQQPSHFYLLRVVYYRSVESGYRGIVSLA